MFKNFIHSSYLALANHPLGAIFYLFFWFLIAFFYDSYIVSDFLFLGLFVIFCETFFTAKTSLKQAYKNPKNFWTIFFGLIFYIFLHFIFKQDENYLIFYTNNTFYISLTIALISLVCARKLHDFDTFHHFLAALSFSISFWLIFGIFLAIFYSSFNFLFDISSSKLNSHVLSLWFFSAGIFSLFLLGNFISYNFNKIFIFILNTFSILYIIMLFAYSLGVLFNLLESLSIVHLCLWFGVFLLFNFWINLSFYKIKKIILYAFFIFLSFLTSFVFYAIITRIIQYGFTPERLAVLTLNLWLIISSFLSVFKQNKALKFSFYLLAFMSLFLGIFANYISISSQKHRLEKLEKIIQEKKSEFDYSKSKQYYDQIKDIKNTIYNLDKNYDKSYSFDEFLKKNNLNHLKNQTKPFNPDLSMYKNFNPEYLKLKKDYDEILFNFTNKSNFKYSMKIQDNILYFYLQEQEILKINDFDKILKTYQKNSQLDYELYNGSTITFIPLMFNIDARGNVTKFKTHIFIKNTK
ncbi:DUF4153 domain-containing protein [Campylobacter sp. RM16704]|uniref:DUF4153 domain-containing protein n=1 Tax=Campylobacter sp. RM16704 TaxID=1500960 RepID=UPI00057EACF9|nr:DUF4153 domain-containing protein [Campylobacter sp. RM16704]AJC85943.1 hypothetical membrane protein (DUF4153 domain) [Campylobacter sp. RM16704]